MKNSGAYIDSVRTWVEKFIVPLNICPFARKEVERQRIFYTVLHFNGDSDFYNQFLQELRWLDSHDEVETSLVILPQLNDDFDVFLNQAGFAQQVLQLEGYEGIFQLANFHPDYIFAGSEPGDPANYTNRAPWPVLHILREASLSKAIRAHKNADIIPQQNIDNLRSLGSEELQKLFKEMFR